MTHLTIDHYPPEHPGSTRTGQLGFYTVVGIAAVSALILLGIYWLTMDALSGLAAFAGRI